MVEECVRNKSLVRTLHECVYVHSVIWMECCKHSCDLLHVISSDMSPQSSSRSQLHPAGIQRPFWHENCSVWQDWAMGEEKGNLIRSQPHKSMQDCTTTLMFTRSARCQCPVSANSLSLNHTVGLTAVGNVLLFDGPSVKRWWSCTWQHTSNVLLMWDIHVNLPGREHSSSTG